MRFVSTLGDDGWGDVLLFLWFFQPDYVQAVCAPDRGRACANVGVRRITVFTNLQSETLRRREWPFMLQWASRRKQAR